MMPHITMKNQKNVDEWNAILELDETITEDRADALMDALADYAVSVGSAPHNRISVTLTLPASNLMQAVRTAIAVAEAASSANVIGLEVLPTEEFDARSGLEPIPALVSVAEAAEMLEVTKIRVNQMISEGKFSTARKVGSSFVLAYAEVALRKSRTPAEAAAAIIRGSNAAR
jgi:hypothetical protein